MTYFVEGLSNHLEPQTRVRRIDEYPFIFRDDDKTFNVPGFNTASENLHHSFIGP